MDVQQLTERNRVIAEKYSQALGDSIEGMLLSGSNAWGADHAVNAASDIDLLLVGSLMELTAAIDTLVSLNLLGWEEKKRFDLFSDLFRSGEGEFFSAIADQTDVKVRIDFMPSKIAKRICRLEPVGNQFLEGVQIRTAKELRTNTPKSTGYSVDGLKGETRLTYHPSYKIIENGGYLADTLVDGMNEQSYFMGVMAFFFAVNPVILADRDGKLKSLISLAQGNIRKQIGGAPIYITRQERMSPDMLESIKNSLT